MAQYGVSMADVAYALKQSEQSVSEQLREMLLKIPPQKVPVDQGTYSAPPQKNHTNPHSGPHKRL